MVDIRIELQDAETGDEIVPNSYTSYEIVRSFIGQGDSPDVFIVTHFVKVHAMIIWDHYNVFCQADVNCPHWDAEQGAWWDTVPEPAADADYNLGTALADHLKICVGPFKVEKIAPKEVKDDGTVG